MAVVLKSQVVDHLRAARAADDTLAKLQENSWENQRKSLVRLVESANWRHGPAELLATFDHHLIAKSPSGDVVQVEWSRDGEGEFHLGRANVYESATPVSDVGHEVMETALAAVDRILDEDVEGVTPMLASVTEALDAGGDLQRRITNEVEVRNLSRDAWWHPVVGLREGVEEQIPEPNLGDVQQSATDLLAFLKEQTASLSLTARQLDGVDSSIEVETLARDIAEDLERAVSALVNVDRRQDDEVTKIYEAVVSAAPKLLSGIAFLNELTSSADETA